MNPSPPKLLTRSELAALMTEMRGDKVTVAQILANESQWGLDKMRRDLNSRVVRYDRDKSLALLRRSHLIPA